MNPLQSGTLSSQLTSQDYSNSSQRGEFQSTYSGSAIQQSGYINQSLTSTNSGQTLQVYDRATTGVLGVKTNSTIAVPQHATASSQSSTYLLPVGLTLFLSIFLAAFFFRKFKQLAAPTKPDTAS